MTQAESVSYQALLGDVVLKPEVPQPVVVEFRFYVEKTNNCVFSARIPIARVPLSQRLRAHVAVRLVGLAARLMGTTPRIVETDAGGL